MVSAGPCEHPPRSWSLTCPEGVTSGSFALLFTYLFVHLALWKGWLGEAWNPNQQPQVREVASCRCHCPHERTRSQLCPQRRVTGPGLETACLGHTRLQTVSPASWDQRRKLQGLITFPEPLGSTRSSGQWEGRTGHKNEE